ncbi:MAG TPA: amino acid adenylation domain-containing protein, partial [Candidatus Deferrimicrobium sp.]|nr:amino acid adenylation domain-containing protein [Candidatus Deferrimicrobium sp.]
MLIAKFKEQVKRNPHKPAIKGEKENFTYEELDRASTRLARLIKQPGNPCHNIGLLFEHGPHMIIAILGALKAGKTYVPLSADYPVNRLSYMLSHAQAGLIITNTQNAKLAGELSRENNIDVINVDIGAINTSNMDCSIENDHVPGNDIAYIMFTSGSTGRPKGVMQTIENILYYTRNWARLFSITDTDRMTLFSSFCHDGSVQDVFSALLNGATLYPYDLKKREDSAKLSDFLVTEKITVWHSVPSLFSYFCTTLNGSEEFPDLRFILLGGEPLREHELANAGKFFPHSLVGNIYGQTESSVNSVWLVDPAKRKLTGNNMKLRLGEPLDETEILVVDDAGNEVDVFAQGEIVIVSKYLSPGYWRDPENTRKTFSEDEDLGRLYWTGDLGRVLPGEEVNIEFLSRKDFQVKIRGFRIELGEIENQLLEHGSLKEAVVTARENVAGEKYLAAYYTLLTKNGPAVTVTDLKNYLKNELPDYMIPTTFMELDQFPLTQSKKIDRKALPEPVDPATLALQAIRESGQEYVAPRTPVEENVAGLWAEILGLEKRKLSIDANFFELGGHSLKATIMAAKIQQMFAVKIPFVQMFTSYTIRTLSEYITRNAAQAEGIYIPIEAAEEKEYYPLSSAQERLFFLQQLDPEGTGYNIPIVLELLGDLHINILTETFKKLVQRHESFRTSFHVNDGKTVQKIHRHVDFKIEIIIQAPKSLETLIKEFNRPFDLSSAPLLRVGLIKIADNNHLLMLNMHHIISDGT